MTEKAAAAARNREARQKRERSLMFQTQTHVSRSDDQAISLLAARYSMSRYAMIRALIRAGLAEFKLRGELQ